MTLCRIRSSALEMLIDPGLAGRVLSLTFEGEELLTSADVNPSNFGATFWTSPQADWGWPPVAEVDSAPYAIAEGAPLSLSSAIAQIGPRRFRVHKAFVPLRGGAILTEYAIENVGAEAFRMASWEISRVAAGGLTFFPSGAAELSPIAPHGQLKTEKQAGATFFDHRQFALGQSVKLHADGTEGYLAHLAGDLLVLKVFRDTQPHEQAPGEGEVEIFANEDGKYVEIEVQGPYDEIAPGGRGVFAVRTQVVRVPEAITRDHAALKELASSEARRVSALEHE